jgi:enediyne biosynthesis protein E7
VGPDLLRYWRDPIGLLAEAAAGPGDVARLRIGRPTLLLKRPDDVAHVLAVNQAGYEKTPRMTGPRGRRVVGEGVFTAVNERAAERRGPVQPRFRRPAIAAAGGAISACADRTLDGWRSGEPIDLEREMAGIAIDALMVTLFGPGVEGDLVDGLAVRRRGFRRALHAPARIPARLPLAVVPRRRRALRRLESELARTTRDRREAPGPDLVSALAHAGGLDDRHIRAEVLTLALTGFETVARALGWTLRALAEQPDAAGRVRREVAEAVGERRPGGEDWPALPYTEAVVSEVLRLRPPTPIVVRVACASDRLPSGAEVRLGDKVLVSPYVLHRDPALHPDPERFDPERFSPEARRARSPFAYVPFGAGPRVCIGKNLALLECVLVAARAVQRFEIGPAEPGPAVLGAPRLRPSVPPAVRVMPVRPAGRPERLAAGPYTRAQ